MADCALTMEKKSKRTKEVGEQDEPCADKVPTCQFQIRGDALPVDVFVFVLFYFGSTLILPAKWLFLVRLPFGGHLI